MTYLVDANVLSEPTRPDPSPRVIEWLRRNEREIAVDPVVLGEIRFGILVLPRGRRRVRLERWFDDGVGRLHCPPLGHGHGAPLGTVARRPPCFGPLDADQGQSDCLHRPRASAHRGHPEST